MIWAKSIWRTGVVMVLIFWLCGNALAAHPSLLLDSTELAFIRSKVAKNTEDWQALKTQCDGLVPGSVQWPHALSGGGSGKRGMVVNYGHGSPYLFTGFHGSGWDKTITQLGICYQAVKSNDAGRASKYLTQAHYVITAMGQPFIKMVRQSDGMTRYAASMDTRGFDLLAGAPPQVLLVYDKTVNIGDVWTISGATGCTNLNGTWKVASKRAWSIFFANADGTIPSPLNANCTLYSVAFGDYAARFYMPALAKAYDWFYDGLSANYPGDIANLKQALTAWGTEMSFCPTHTGNEVENNYTHSYLWALTAEYVAVNDDIPELGTLVSNMLSEKLDAIRDYRGRWLAGGGAGEGWQAYGYGSIRRMLNAELAMKMHGVDWSKPPYNFTLLDDTLIYFMEFTTPTKLALDDNEYVYPLGTSYIRSGDYRGYHDEWFPTESVYIPLSDAAMYSAMANRFGSPYAGKFQSWYNTVYAAEKSAAGTLLPEWADGTKPHHSAPAAEDVFLYSGEGASPSDWTALPLMYRAWSGNYAVTRSDWSNSATEVTLLGGPSVGSAGNGKTQFDSGAISIQSGNKRLVVYGLGEASRSTDLVPGYTPFNNLHKERRTNKKNSIWWAAKDTAQPMNQFLGSRIPPPGQAIKTTSWPSSIDRIEDEKTYTYFRAVHLEANGTHYSGPGGDGKYHQVAWTRELLFLRPKLVIVHDRTATLDPTDERAMFWTFGRNITRVTSGVPAGMTRYDASYKGMYRGAFTSVLPMSAAITVADHDNLHFLYRAEVRPSAMDHTDDNWLAVFDTAESAGQVTPLTAVAAQNADAVQLGNASHTVVAFSRSGQPILPITIVVNHPAEAYVADLNPNTNYKVTATGTSLTIATDDGTSRVMSSEAGVLRILSR
jgi:hypothetical protein